MKAIFTALVCALALMFSPFGVQAQSGVTVTRQGNTFVQVTTKGGKSSAQQTKYTYEVGGKKYPIFITKNGRCFINKVSSKSGKEYKYYLDEETSKTIAKEMGITYVPKQQTKQK